MYCCRYVRARARVLVFLYIQDAVDRWRCFSGDAAVRRFFTTIVSITHTRARSHARVNKNLIFVCGLGMGYDGRGGSTRIGGASKNELAKQTPASVRLERFVRAE